MSNDNLILSVSTEFLQKRRYQFYDVVSYVHILQRVLQKVKQRTELADTANTKLLHECGILRSRLQECSVNFLIEEEDKLIVDTSLPSDAIDLLVTSDNRIGLLLAEVSFRSFVPLAVTT